jgi:hypothetical protein
MGRVVGFCLEGYWERVILELLEWCVTPATWKARSRGFLAGQIAIRHRAHRCRAAWRSHLDACRAFVAARLSACNHGNDLVILGSGHLHDFDLAFLKTRFVHITLVDAVHPVEIQVQACLSQGRLRLVASDISACSPALSALVDAADLVVSSCLLSQLPLHLEDYRQARCNDEATTAITDPVFAAHLALLGRARRSILITDTAQRFAADSPWRPLLDGFELLHPISTWIWKIAPRGEHGQETEERMVEAFYFERDQGAAASRHSGTK